jgi:hypothetical protein
MSCLRMRRTQFASQVSLSRISMRHQSSALLGVRHPLHRGHVPPPTGPWQDAVNDEEPPYIHRRLVCTLRSFIATALDRSLTRCNSLPGASALHHRELSRRLAPLPASSLPRTSGPRRHPASSPASTPSSTTNTMPLSSELVAPVCERPSALLKLASTRPVSPSSSPPDRTP